MLRRLPRLAGLEEIKAFANSCLAQVYLIAGRLREAVEAGERALASFEAMGNLWWAGRTISHLSPAAIALGQWNASLGYCRRALEYGATLGDLRLKVVGLYRMGGTYIQQGDPNRGVQCCNEALALGPLPFDAAMAKGLRGYGEIRAGRVDAGIADLGEAIVWFEKSRLRYPRLRFALWLVEGHLRRDDRGRRPTPDRSGDSRRAEPWATSTFEGTACWLMGECLAPEDPSAAERYLETAMEILGRIGARNDLARAAVTRASIAPSLWETPRAHASCSTRPTRSSTRSARLMNPFESQPCSPPSTAASRLGYPPEDCEPLAKKC